MLSKNNIKKVKALHLKKNRLNDHVFIAEGVKLVMDLIESGNIPKSLYYSSESGVSNIFPILPEGVFMEITSASMAEITLLSTPSPALGVFEKPVNNINLHALQTSYALYLEEIKDPGNLGTIIRMADWFGIKQIFCSNNCVEIYNPKVVQSTMGSIARVHLHEIELEQLLLKAADINVKLPVMGTMLNGDNLYTSEFPNHGLIVIGNESRGVSEISTKFFTNKIMIPRADGSHTESLNAAIAASVVVSELLRKGMK